jgi:hypothetical protein
MPSHQTVYNWISEREDVSLAIAQAREVGEDVIAVHCLNIADDNSQDITQIDMGDGVIVTRTDHDVIQRAKLRIDTRLKLLAKWNPKKWGDKVDVTSGGNPIPAPVINLAHGQPQPQAD